MRSRLAGLRDGPLGQRWAGSRRAAAVRVAAVPVLVLGLLLWMVVSVLRAGGASGPALYAEFVDPSSSSYLNVQLDDVTSGYGAFSAVVPQQGRVWPKGPVATSTGPAGGVQLRYDGVGYRDRKVRPPATPHPQVVRLRLAGQVDAARHTATVDLWVDDAPLHIRAPGQPPGAQAVVDKFLAAVERQDWNALYNLETVSMRNGSNRTDFVTGMAHAGMVTNVRAARPTGPTTLTTSPAGVSYARTPIRLTYATGATTTSLDATLVLVVDGGAWGALSLE